MNLRPRRLELPCLSALAPQALQNCYLALTHVYLCIGKAVFVYRGCFILCFIVLSAFIMRYHFRVRTKNVTFNVTQHNQKVIELYAMLPVSLHPLCSVPSSAKTARFLIPWKTRLWASIAFLGHFFRGQGGLENSLGEHLGRCVMRHGEFQVAMNQGENRISGRRKNLVRKIHRPPCRFFHAL